MKSKGKKKTKQKGKTFAECYKLLPNHIKKLVRLEIMDILEVKTIAAFYYHLYGKTKNSSIQIKEIEKIFNKYHIYNIWDNE